MTRRILPLALLLLLGTAYGNAQALVVHRVNPYIVNPAVCPTGGLAYSFSTGYQNGESLGPLKPTVDCAGGASSVSATSPAGQHQNVAVVETLDKPGQPIYNMHLIASLSSATAAQPSPQTTIALGLPPGAVRNTGAFGVCDRAELELMGTCPDDTKVGEGSAIMEAPPIVPQADIPNMTMWNGAGGALYIYGSPAIGPSFVMVGQPTTDGGLVFGVPALRTLPGVQDATITDLQLKLLATGVPVVPKPAPDKTAPTSIVGAKKKQKLRSLSVSVSVNEPAAVAVSGSVVLPGASKRVKFKRVSKSIGANVKTQFKLRLSSKNARLARKAMRRGRKLTAKLGIAAVDKAQNTSRSKVNVRLVR